MGEEVQQNGDLNIKFFLTQKGKSLCGNRYFDVFAIE